MECEGTCGGIREAEYEVVFGDGIVNVCGYCLIADYVTSKGLQSRVLEVVKILWR